MAPRQRITTSSNGSSSEDSSTSGKEAEPIVLSSSSSTSKTLNFQNGQSATTHTDGTSTANNVVEHEVVIHDRDRHDIFNLVALPIMLGAVLMNWDLGVLFVRGLEESWSNHYFFELIFVVGLYFLLDLMWVAVVPTCVKSPGTIIKVSCKNNNNK